VNRIILVAIVVCVICLCVLSVPARAQVGSNCWQWVGNGCIYGYNSAGPCPGWFDCVSEGPWLVVCKAWTSACPPPAAISETGCGPGCSTAANPINLANGNAYIEETDIKIPGLGGGLSLTRIWNSVWPSTQTAFQNGIFGPNWRSTFEERVFWGSDNYVKYARSDGSFWSFGVGGPGFAVAAPANAGVTLVQGSSYWTMTFKDGEKRLFDNTSGDLIAIIDRNGNTTGLSYDAVGRLVTVTDPASRHLYFSYASPTSFLVTSVTSDFGESVSYSYDAQGRLVQVTEPDQSTYNFDYDAQSLIADVKDSNGTILEAHTYDASGRGLTSTRANGVDAVTVSYPNQ
jgi:YD repeat-containing protein